MKKSIFAWICSQLVQPLGYQLGEVVSDLDGIYRINNFPIRKLIQQIVVKTDSVQNDMKKVSNLKTLYDFLPRRERVYHNAYHRMAHYIYPEGATEEIKVQHVEPKGVKEWIAYYGIRSIRRSYDFLTSYRKQNMTVAKWVQRCLILETVAGVPGMVGGMARHLKSLRIMQRDKGWIHHLLEEADNERFHLFIFLNIKKPGYLERAFIISLQGIFFNMFFISYLLAPKFSHRFVGYLQEQAVKTYTAMLEDINDPNGVLHEWSKVIPEKEIRDYYQLGETATMRDIIACIRADEACHRATNHYLASVDQDIEIPQQFVKVINEKTPPDAPGKEKDLMK